MDKQCWSCGTYSINLRSCADCNKARYCDESCQENNWPMHSGECMHYHHSADPVDTANWLEDAIEVAAANGNVDKQLLDHGRNLVDSLKGLNGTFDSHSDIINRGINLVLELEVWDHQLTADQIDKAINMEFDDSFTTRDLLSALDKKNQAGVYLLEALMDEDELSIDEIESDSENNYIGSEFSSNSESDDLPERELSNDDTTIDASSEDSVVEYSNSVMRVYYTALYEFEQNLALSQKVANRLHKYIQKSEADESSLSFVHVRSAIRALTHITRCISVADGYDFIGRRQRRRRRGTKKRRQKKRQRRTARRAKRKAKKESTRKTRKTKKTKKKEKRKVKRKKKRRAKKKMKRRRRDENKRDKKRERKANKRGRKQQQRSRRRTQGNTVILTTNGGTGAPETPLHHNPIPLEQVRPQENPNPMPENDVSDILDTELENEQRSDEDEQQLDTPMDEWRTTKTSIMQEYREFYGEFIANQF